MCAHADGNIHTKFDAIRMRSGILDLFECIMSANRLHASRTRKRDPTIQNVGGYNVMVNEAV